MAIYRNGKLAGAGGSIASTIFTDGVTLEGDGSRDNRVRVKNAGINTAHLGENAVNLSQLAHGTAGRIIAYDASGAPIAGQKSSPKVIFWGRNQKSRVGPSQTNVYDFNRYYLPRFKSSSPDEHYFGGDQLGTIMLSGTLPSFVTTNVDSHQPGGSNQNLNLHSNQFFQLPSGIWNIHFHAFASQSGNSSSGFASVSMLQVTSSTDDIIQAHSPGWLTASAYRAGTVYDLIIPALETDGTEYFYFVVGHQLLDVTKTHDHFLMLEKLQ